MKTQRLVLVTMIAAASAAQAATVTSVGTVTNQPGWHSTGVAKSFDADGDNRYGTDGYVIFGVTNQADNTGIPTSSHGYSTTAFGDAFSASNNNGVTVFNGTSGSPGAYASGLPSYISSLSAGTSYTSTAANFATVSTPQYANGDDPRLVSAATVADARIGGSVGPLGDGTTVGTYQNIFSFTVAAGSPSTFRVGILFGNINDFFTPTAIRISQNGGGGTATIASLVMPAAPELDWAFFDITGATAGTKFDIFAQVRDRAASTNDRTALDGIVFDHAVATVPTPMALPAGLMMLSIAAMRRRK
ncbi:MAG: hypothetical protein GC162_08915 [Planctomycetes bacterium]|nr:hypothetical protein [Planctomycetota bacterium]